MNTKAKHTPEPWDYTENKGANYGYVANKSTIICGIPNEIRQDRVEEFEEEKIANAYLIVAAPKLLEAAKKAPDIREIDPDKFYLVYCEWFDGERNKAIMETEKL